MEGVWYDDRCSSIGTVRDAGSDGREPTLHVARFTRETLRLYTCFAGEIVYNVTY